MHELVAISLTAALIGGTVGLLKFLFNMREKPKREPYSCPFGRSRVAYGEREKASE